jgi:hypothetical protein
MKSILLTTLSVLFCAVQLFSQCAIKGSVTDKDSKEPVLFVNITVFQKDSVYLHGTSDFNGLFCLSVPEGIYDVEFQYLGYSTEKLVDLSVTEDEEVELDIRLKTDGVSLSEVVVKSYKVPSREYAEARSEGLVLGKESKRRKKAGRDKAADLYIDGIRVTDGAATAMPTMAKSTVPASSAPASTAAFETALEWTTPIRPDKDGNSPEVKAGLLTAGERNDLDNWEYWEEILSKDTIGEFQDTWQIYPNQRYSIRITNTEGLAIPNCTVHLQGTDGKNLWTSITDNYGNAELWGNPFAKEKSSKELFLVAEYEGREVLDSRVFDFSKRINKYQIEAKCQKPTNADIMFVVDATGSMCDEINYLKAELKDVISKVAAQDDDLNIRLGSLFYRDKSDEYITVSSGLSDDIDEVSKFINNQYCGGGGDYPEAVHTALQEAINRQDWREDAVARIVFLVLDAPPHEDQEVLNRLKKDVILAAKKGIKIIPVVASGIDKSTEFLMRYFSVITNGTYVFLTDHSGIGNPHLEPTVDSYDVENLNDLLVRLISKYTIHGGCLNSETIASTEEEDTFDVSFYPNPSAGYVVVEINDNNTSVSVFDNSGKQVFVQKDLPAGRHELNLTNLISGSYAIRFEHEEKVQNGKLIILGRA